MYQLTISKRQAEVIKEALDLRTRLLCGQFTELKSLFNDLRLNNSEADSLLIYLKKMAFPDLQYNMYYGIYGKDTDETAKIAYDIIQVIRYQIAKDRIDKNVYSIDNNPPLKASNTEKLPKIRR